ncbi:acetyltransferase [Isoptericola sp. b441]|uniref:Acetyltransferase n=1 Tax=Actinotalea lenta TaxID=3064654 RepID=A0ABT9DCA9_9CELL|nr:acetyltransferase [Isoptericola sp. b441]MDO8108514.1 acetyltransferase [Isoptericola sp. b441]
MSTPLYIIGAGGFGREVFAIVQAVRESGGEDYDVTFVDDHPAPVDLARVAALSAEVVGTVDGLKHSPGPFAAVVAIGANSLRRRVVERLAGAPVTYPVLVHPDATVGRDVQLGDGTIVAPGARLSVSIRIGRHVHIDQNVTIGHDSTLGDFCRVNPQACVSGSVAIGDEALVGAAATVLQGLELGTGSVVGAGAVVTRSVAPGTTVKGVPAR